MMKRSMMQGSRTFNPYGESPDLPWEVTVYEDGSCSAAYSTGVGVAYESIGKFLKATKGTYRELLGLEYDLERVPSYISAALVDLADRQGGEAAEGCAEAIYMERLGEAFPIETLCDLTAEVPWDLMATRIEVGVPPLIWCVENEVGMAWWPCDVVSAALFKAHTDGLDAAAAAIRICAQAPNLGNWVTVRDLEAALRKAKGR